MPLCVDSRVRSETQPQAGVLSSDLNVRELPPAIPAEQAELIGVPRRDDLVAKLPDSLV